jgi:hypothetical protein
MFLLQDMVMELAVVAVVLAVVLLSVAVLATTCRESLERRRAHAGRARLRRRVWRDYAAACAPAEALTPAPAPVVAGPVAEVPVRAGRDRRAGLTAGAATA